MQNDNVVQKGSELNDEFSRIWRIRYRIISFCYGFRDVFNALTVFLTIQSLGVFILLRFMSNISDKQTSFIVFGLIEIASVVLTILFYRSFRWNKNNYASLDPSAAEVFVRKEKMRKVILDICIIAVAIQSFLILILKSIYS